MVPVRLAAVGSSLTLATRMSAQRNEPGGSYPARLVVLTRYRAGALLCRHAAVPSCRRPTADQANWLLYSLA